MMNDMGIIGTYLLESQNYRYKMNVARRRIIKSTESYEARVGVK
jgi:hypothetical protein